MMPQVPETVGERLRALDHYDLSFLATPAIERSHGAITAHTVSLGLRELKRFLALHLEHPTVALTPSQVLDEVWHQFILHSQQYREFWSGLGLPHFEHNPADPNGPPPLAGYDRTLKLYRAQWGEPPAEIWGAGIISSRRYHGNGMTPLLYGGLAAACLLLAGLTWRTAR